MKLVKVKISRTIAIKTKRPGFSLVTRNHRLKIDMTDVILIDMWLSSHRSRFRESRYDIKLV